MQFQEVVALSLPGVVGGVVDVEIAGNQLEARELAGAAIVGVVTGQHAQTTEHGASTEGDNWQASHGMLPKEFAVASVMQPL